MIMLMTWVCSIFQSEISRPEWVLSFVGLDLDTNPPLIITIWAIDNNVEIKNEIECQKRKRVLRKALAFHLT